MTKIIYKYSLKFCEKQVILLPRKAKVLKINQQNQQQYFLWALVDLKEDIVNTTVLCIGTGCYTPKNINEFEYINTVEKDGFVWHFFIEQHT